MENSSCLFCWLKDDYVDGMHTLEKDFTAGIKCINNKLCSRFYICMVVQNKFELLL